MFERCALDGAEQVHGDGLYTQLAEREGQFDALLHRLAHADDAAATHVHAHAAGCLQRTYLLLLRMRGAEGGEVAGSRFEVAVVASHAGFVQLPQFVFIGQAQRGTELDGRMAAQVAHRVTKLFNLFLGRFSSAGHQ